jgi:hypothetical protein
MIQAPGLHAGFIESYIPYWIGPMTPIPKICKNLMKDIIELCTFTILSMMTSRGSIISRALSNTYKNEVLGI